MKLAKQKKQKQFLKGNFQFYETVILKRKMRVYINTK